MKRMIRTFILLLAGSLWLSYGVQGQDQKKPPETAKSSKVPIDYKWDASVDMYHIFWGYGIIMLRYAPNKNGAYRFVINNINIGKRKDQQYSDSLGNLNNEPLTIYKRKSYDLSVQAGYEFHRTSVRHQIFYGLDMDFYGNFFDEDPASIVQSRIYNFGIIPFAGLKYRIIDRLSVSAELSCSLRYNLVTGFNEHKIKVHKGQSWDFSFNSLRVINLSYHF